MLSRNSKTMFKLTLTNGQQDIDLDFRIRDTEIAVKWFAELSKSYNLYEVNRFSNWGEYDIIDKLNHHIDIINYYDFIIDRKVSETTQQQDLNYLHKFFEIYRGEVSVGTDWFNSAPKEVQYSLEQYNILIHQLEATLRTGNKHPTVVVTFQNPTRIELEKEDIKHFTYKWQSGTVYINYCMVGKTVLDAYKDGDKLTNAIRPQTHYSADFMIKFGPSTGWISYIIRSILIKMWLWHNRIRFKNLNLGMIPVADLITDIDRQTLLKFKTVKSVVCIK